MKAKEPTWITGTALAELIGCSPAHIKRLRQHGQLKKRKHWIVLNPDAICPHYRYHRQHCLNFFADEA